jgi:ligand-binding sensor domain-containing protein
MTEQRTRAKGMPRRILLAVLLVLATSVQALVPGNRYLVRPFGAGYGLSTGVNTAVRTQDGYLWLGTFGGLYRFDGTKATRFQVQRPGSKAGAGSGPASDRITALHEDVRGRLWIGTQDGGFTLYERGRFQLLPFCGGTCQVHAFVVNHALELVDLHAVITLAAVLDGENLHQVAHAKQVLRPLAVAAVGHDDEIRSGQQHHLVR